MQQAQRRGNTNDGPLPLQVQRVHYQRTTVPPIQPRLVATYETSQKDGEIAMVMYGAPTVACTASADISRLLAERYVRAEAIQK